MSDAPVKTLLSVDVGTLSARAGLFDTSGVMISSASAPLELTRPLDDHATYSMAGIWDAVITAVRGCLDGSAGLGGHVAAVAFDATSSLAITVAGGAPLDGGGDVIGWMDHRGEREALDIDATGDGFLDYVGGSISPEMNLPKLLWLKRHRPDVYSRLIAARDLCDELAYRLTGVDRHSVCGLSCKWPYLPDRAKPWASDMLAKLGISDLATIGSLSAEPGRVGEVHGRVSAAGAAAFGIPKGIPVAIGLIDAEAGALGVLGRDFRARMNQILPMIGGTSTCFMPFAPERRLIKGVWGPFKDAVFPGYWMHEGGQSLSGAALDAVLAHHPASPGKPSPERHAVTVAAVLALLDEEGENFAARRHIVPDWLGNRSPLGDGRVRALLTGVGEETSRRSFLEAYYATARALALQTRHVAEHLNDHGFAINAISLSGGHNKNPLLLRLYRDATGADLILSDAPEPVLLGTAMVAAVAAGLQPDLFAALDAMAPRQRTERASPAARAVHERAYRIYRQLYAIRNDVEAAARAT